MCSTFVPKIDSFENNDKQFIKFIINLNTVIMRIFTKSLLTFVLLCIAGVMSAAINLRLADWNNGMQVNNLAITELTEDWQTITVDFGASPMTTTENVNLRFVNTEFTNDMWIQKVEVYENDGANPLASIDYSQSTQDWFWGGWGYNGGSQPVNDGTARIISAGGYYHCFILDWFNVTEGNTYKAIITYKTVMPKQTVWTDIITNGDMESGDSQCFYSTEPEAGGPYLMHFTQGVGKDGSSCAVIKSAKREDTGQKDNNNNIIWTGTDWDAQFFIRIPYELPAGTKFKLSFDYKSSVNGQADTQAHNEPGQYIHWACAGSPNFTGEWQTYATEGTVPTQCDGTDADGGYKKNFQSIAFNLSKNHEATTFYIDNVKFEIDEELLTTLTKTTDPNAQYNPEYRPETAVSVDVEINDTDPAIVAKKTALLSAINRAKDADRTNKTKASMKALDDAVTEGYKMFAPEAQKKKVTVQIPGEDEKKDLTFSTAEYCAAQWDATAQTLTWGQGGWNAAWTFMSADGVSGDLSEWTKLHLKVSDFTNSKENKLKVVFQENTGTMPPNGAKAEGELVPDADGNIDLDMTAFNWGDCPKNNVADMSIYGLERTDETAAASVKVTEAWLAKPTYKEEEQTVDKTQAEILAELTAAAQAIRSAIIDLEDRPAPAAEPAVPDGWKSLITNGTLEGEDMSSFFIVEPDGEGLRQAVREDYAGIDDFHAAVVTSKDAPATDWDTQFFIRSNEVLPKGTKIRVEFDYCASIAGGCDTQAHEEPTKYIHWACIGSPNFTDKWQHFTFEGSVPSQCDGSQHKEGDGSYSGYDNNFHAIAFNLAKNKKATTFYFDNIVFLAEDIQTAVKSVEKAEKPGKGEYFDLQGRRVAKPGKGLYILNGKKVAIK